MRLLLTGGTGFLGRSLLRCLRAQEMAGANRTVTVLTREPGIFLERYPLFRDQSWLNFHGGDILDPASLPRERAFTHVLHAAADSTFGPKLGPLQRYVQIVEGTRNLLDFAVKAGARRFLLTSSGAVYGPQPADMDRIPEDYRAMPDPLDPGNVYGVAKRTAEHLCALYQQVHGIDAVVARCFAFVGEDLPLDVHFAIGNFIRDALRADAITVAGDGTPVRSYLDQRDLAVWLITLLESGRAGRAYNVGSDEAINIADLAHLVRDTLAPGKRVCILGKPDATAVVRNRYVPDVSRARTELGLRVTIPLRQAIRDAAAGMVAAPVPQ